MEENKDKVVLIGTYESSHSKLRFMKTNKDNDNKKVSFNIIRLLLNKFKK